MEQPARKFKFPFKKSKKYDAKFFDCQMDQPEKTVDALSTSSSSSLSVKTKYAPDNPSPVPQRRKIGMVESDDKKVKEQLKVLILESNMAEYNLL